jgi:hypothetical protein
MLDRDINSSDYSYNNSSDSHISYISNINNYMHDTNSINRANLINMIRLMRQDQQESELLDEVNYDDIEENDNDIDNEESNTINSYELFAEMSLLSNNKEKDSSEYSNDIFTEERDYLFLNYRRATTAPTKQLNDSSEFKKSLSYINLEKAVIYSNRLIIEPTEEGEKFDVDSEEGIFICKKFLEQLEKLIYVNIK